MTRRRGFSLVELLIGVVIVGIIGVGLTRLMMNQTRFFSRQSQQRDARSVSRGAMNLLQSDLQNVEVGNGVVSASSTTLQVRIPYAWGVYCSSGTAAIMPVDSLIYATSVYAGYAWKDTSLAGAYTYVAGTTAPAAGTAANCTGLTPAITAPTGGRYLALPTTPVTAAGSPVFLYQTITYEFKASTLMSGRTALWRTVTNGSADEIVVPFAGTAGFRFYRLFADTAQSGVPSPVTEIRGIELQLHAQSRGRTSGRATVESAQIRSAIFFRNRVN